MKIALAQTKPVTGDIKSNIFDHLIFIDRAIEKGADAIFFPELSLTGYEPTLAEELAFSLSDPSLEVFQQKSDSNNIIIGAGAPFRLAEGIGIGMALFVPQTRMKRYFKKYLHPDEEPFFISHEEYSGHLNTTPAISLAICYEISIEKHLQSVSDYGAKIYLASVAKFINGMDNAWSRMAQIAQVHKVIAMMVNCVGPADNGLCAGKSAVWNHHGELLGALGSDHPGLLIYDSVTMEVGVFLI